MIPLKDNIPTRSFPLITILLIAVNTAVHLYHMFLTPEQSYLFTYRFGLIPVELINLQDMTPQVPFPVLLSPFTSMFIHADLLHLGGNMLYLWIFGNNVEDYLGKFRFLIFYFLSGLAAAFMFTVFSPHGEVPLIGASGAIAGILGAYMILYPRARVLTFIWIIFFIRLIWLPAILMLGYWFVIQIIMALSETASASSGGVAWLAHVGGFIFGMAAIRIYSSRHKSRDLPPPNNNDYYNRWH